MTNMLKNCMLHAAILAYMSYDMQVTGCGLQ
jgi:hypothetical protein